MCQIAQYHRSTILLMERAFRVSVDQRNSTIYTIYLDCLALFNNTLNSKNFIHSCIYITLLNNSFLLGKKTYCAPEKRKIILAN